MMVVVLLPDIGGDERHAETIASHRISTIGAPVSPIRDWQSLGASNAAASAYWFAVVAVARS